MKAYKGFRSDMKCRDFQYEEGKSYTFDGEIELCHNGFHSCEFPLDVLRFYNPADSIYYEVEIGGEMETDEDDMKTVSSEIEIKERLEPGDFIYSAILLMHNKLESDFVSITKDTKFLSQTMNEYSVSVSLGDLSISKSVKNNSISATTGKMSVAYNSAIYSISSNTGCDGIGYTDRSYSISATTGDVSLAYCDAGRGSIAAATGFHSKAETKSEYCIAGTTMPKSVSVTKDINSIACSTANKSHSKAEKARSISICMGNQSKSETFDKFSIASNISSSDSKSEVNDYGSVALSLSEYGFASANAPNTMAIIAGLGFAKGVKGSFLIFANWKKSKDDNNYSVFTEYLSGKANMNPKIFYVDGENVKENTWYTVEGDSLVEYTIKLESTYIERLFANKYILEDIIDNKEGDLI